MRIKTSEKGITLIALVITIIVLLILAAVSIATLTGENGIITKVREAKEQTEYNNALEEVRLAVLAARTAYEGKGKKITLSEECANTIQTELIKMSKNGKVYVDGAFMYAENRNYIFEIDENMQIEKSDIEIVEGDTSLWVESNGILVEYKGDISELDGKTFVIPNYVGDVRIKEIRPELFKDKIKSPLQVELKISNGIKIIGDGAFSGCTGLTGNLIVPDSITTIGGGAFGSCNGLTGGLIIPDNVVSIGIGAFANCTEFNGELKLGNSITTIESGAFASCGFTGGLIIPDSVTFIGSGAFSGCTGFNGKLKLGSSITTIESGAFVSSKFIGDLEIPNTVTTLGGGAFSGCTGFNGKLTIGLKDIPSYMMANQFGGTSFTELEITEGTKTIGDSAFESAKTITLVSVDANIDTMGAKALAIGTPGTSKIIYIKKHEVRPSGWSEDWVNYYYNPKVTSNDYKFPYRETIRGSSGWYEISSYNYYYFDYYYYGEGGWTGTCVPGKWSEERNQIAVIWADNSARRWYQPKNISGTWY